MIVFACISPHAPIFLPTVGSPTDREKVKSTIFSLESLAPKLTKSKPDIIIISSPHKDWGINVPLHFLESNLKFEILNLKSISNDLIKNLPAVRNQLEIKNSILVLPILTSLDSPKKHYEFGQQLVKSIDPKTRICWIASGDMSHTLKADGPYGFNQAGPEYDQEFIDLLKKKDVQGILNLDSDLDWLNNAGQCGLNSFSMVLGALEELKTDWFPKILSYEGPFGVGYLVAQLV